MDLQAHFAIAAVISSSLAPRNQTLRSIHDLRDFSHRAPSRSGLRAELPPSRVLVFVPVLLIVNPQTPVC